MAGNMDNNMGLNSSLDILIDTYCILEDLSPNNNYLALSEMHC